MLIILPTNRTYMPTGHMNSLSYPPKGPTNRTYMPTGHMNSLSYQHEIPTHCPTYQQDIPAYYPTYQQDIRTHCPTYQKDPTCLFFYLPTGPTHFLPTGPTLCREQVTMVKPNFKLSLGERRIAQQTRRSLNKKKGTQSAWIVARNLLWCDFPMFLALVV